MLQCPARSAGRAEAPGADVTNPLSLWVLWAAIGIKAAAQLWVWRPELHDVARFQPSDNSVHQKYGIQTHFVNRDAER